MLANIAAATEPHRRGYRLKEALQTYGRDGNVSVVDLIALSVQHTMERISPAAVIVPTRGGSTARNIARFRLPVWITAFATRESVCQDLQFSYGVNAVHVSEAVGDWDAFSRDWLQSKGITDGLAILTQGPSPEYPVGNHRMDILELGAMPPGGTASGGV